MQLNREGAEIRVSQERSFRQIYWNEAMRRNLDGISLSTARRTDRVAAVSAGHRSSTATSRAHMEDLVPAMPWP